MYIRIAKLILPLIFIVGCNAPRIEHKESGKSSIVQELQSSPPGAIDTNRMVKVATQDILESLQGQQIRKSEIDENGDYYIEYNEDTTNSDSSDIVWQYYLIEKKELITGNLNSDGMLDFAIRSTWGMTIGNMYGLEWHVYVSHDGNYKRIGNEFGGGKFSDMESVKEIDEMKVKTEFQEYDMETASLKDSIGFREYKLAESALKRIK